MNRTAVFIIIFVKFTILSCSDNSLQKSEFKRYMSDVFNIDIEKKENNIIYYPIHMQGCHKCIKLNIEMLQNINAKKNIIIPILVGKYRKKKLQEEINNLKQKYNCLIDNKQNIFRYRTSFGKPLLIRISNGKIKKYKEITDYDIVYIKKYILLFISQVENKD